MRPRERAVPAAQREIREEVGCELTDLSARQFYAWEEDGFAVELWIVTATTLDEPAPDGVEIAEAGFFPVDDLPSPLAPEVREHLELVALRDSFDLPIPAYIRPEYLQALHDRPEPSTGESLT